MFLRWTDHGSESSCFLTVDQSEAVLKSFQICEDMEIWGFATPNDKQWDFSAEVKVYLSIVSMIAVYTIEVFLPLKHSTLKCE